MVTISERSLEETIEASLLHGGPDDETGVKGEVHYPSETYVEFVPGGYRKRKPDELEKLYVFARLLRRYLPVEPDSLPREIQQNIDMESYRLHQTWKGKIKLERGNGKVEPVGPKGTTGVGPEEIEPLSQIIRELNERFGTDFTDEDRVFIQNLEQKLAGDQALIAAVQTNSPENARLAFDYVANDRRQDMVDANFKFYKRITDDKDFGKFFLDWLFGRFRKALESKGNSPDADTGDGGNGGKYEAV
ncbi:MAG: hypothetical protein AB1512_29230 [Thermodesulfobacteriota bacterium]